jgi:hypothetical protein
MNEKLYEKFACAYGKRHPSGNVVITLENKAPGEVD